MIEKRLRRAKEQRIKKLVKLPGVDARLAEVLLAAGFLTPVMVQEASNDALLAVPGLGKKTLAKIRG